MNRFQLLPFTVAALAMVVLVGSAGRLGAPTVVRVLDPSGAPYADAVVLANPGWHGDSIALVTDRGGRATLPRLDCKMCVVTVLDPRRMFLDKTTEFEGGAPSVTLSLRVRPVVDVMFNPGAIRADVQVKSPDGKVIPEVPVMVRKRVGTMEDNTFTLHKTDQQGRISLKLRPGQYILAGLVDGRILEAPLDLAPAVKRKCSEVESDCYIGSAARSPIPSHLALTLAPQGEAP
jgi:hypothetical protein